MNCGGFRGAHASGCNDLWNVRPLCRRGSMSDVLGGEATATAALFMLLLGGLVFFARPGAPLNRVLGVLFVLHAATEYLFYLTQDPARVAQRDFHHAVGHWYETPLPFLTLLLLHHLVPPRGRAPWRWWALGAAGALTLILSPLNPVGALVGSDVHAEESMRTLTSEAALAFLWGSRGAAVVVAAWAVSSEARSALQRQQAALVGLAFSFLLAYSLLPKVLAATLGGRFDLFGSPSTVVGALAVACVLPALPRLVQPFDGRGRVLAAAAATVPLVVGVFHFLLHHEPWFVSLRPLMVAAYTACLALAIVRYDLVGLGPRLRRRLEVFSRGMLASGALLLPSALTLVLLGASSAALVATLGLAVGALAISPAPASALARGFTRLFAPDPHDPSVAAERVRLYADALRRHSEGAPELSRLREDLGLHEADHHAVARLLEDPARAPRDPPILGRYLPERELGRGAFGTAILARDLGTGRHVVLKRFHATWAEKRALAEAEALARVRHPRVVPLLSVERAGDQVFLVLEYVKGGSLQALLDASGPLPPERAVRLVLDVLEGLEAIHGAGLAHGDVKPANVLLDGRGRALLADLGAAQALARMDADLTLTASPVVGSYATVAPEVLRGGRRTAAADVYSTGATLYRLLAGQPYVDLEGKDVLRAAEAILHAPPRLPHPAVPAEVEAVIARALAKTPGERYASAAQMRHDLAEASLRLPPSSPSS